MQELERIKTFVTMVESHKYCNAFSLVMIGRGTDDRNLLDCNGKYFSTVQSFSDQISRIPSLFNKPKFLLIQRYVKGTSVQFVTWKIQDVNFILSSNIYNASLLCSDYINLFTILYLLIKWYNLQMRITKPLSSQICLKEKICVLCMVLKMKICEY